MKTVEIFKALRIITLFSVLRQTKLYAQAFLHLPLLKQELN